MRLGCPSPPTPLSRPYGRRATKVITSHTTPTTITTTSAALSSRSFMAGHGTSPRHRLSPDAQAVTWQAGWAASIRSTPLVFWLYLLGIPP